MQKKNSVIKDENYTSKVSKFHKYEHMKHISEETFFKSKYFLIFIADTTIFR